MEGMAGMALMADYKLVESLLLLAEWLMAEMVLMAEYKLVEWLLQAREWLMAGKRAMVLMVEYKQAEL